MFKNVGSLTLGAVLLTVVPPAAQAQKSQGSAREQEAKLIAVLKSDASRKAKADACRELARVGSQESVAPLAALLCDEELSHMARYGLEPIPDPSVDAALRDALEKAKGRQLVGVIGSIGVRRDPKALPALAKLLGDSDAEVSCAAARSLGRIGSLEAATTLEKALPNAPEAGRLAVCEGLFRCADALRAQGQRQEARTIYEQLRAAAVPEHVKQGATRAEDSLRPAQR
jgi:HEAT repeat protein